MDHRAPSLIASAVILLAACGPDTPKKEWKLVEYIKLAGSCSEDHVGEEADYEGSIVHWHDVQKKADSRYGSVHRWSNVAERMRNQHKYFPPEFVEFRDLDEADVAGDQLRLSGLSNRPEGGPRYEATCLLRVTERLDHIPGSPGPGGKPDRK